MPKVSFIIPGSPNDAFYSQIAAISHSLSRLNWHRWEYGIHAYFGGHHQASDGPVLMRWLPYLQDVTITRVSERHYCRDENWAQCDEVMISAPRDADVIAAVDADTLPVADIESVLDEVRAANCVAGVTAHFPFPGAGGMDHWNRIAQETIGKNLDFDYTHSLVAPGEPDDRRRAPFYLNGGVVFYSRNSFNRIFRRYMRIRRKLMQSMTANDFSAQVATTLAIADQQVPIKALPMRFNFPNDLLAQTLHPDELSEVVIFHYLRTDVFNRHAIFASAEEYQRFMAMELHGPNLVFRDKVRTIFGEQYPFPPVS